MLRRAFSIYAETNDWVPLRSDVERALEISRRLGHQGLERVALGYLVEASEDRQELLAWIDEAEGLARKEGRWADVASTLQRRAMLLVDDRASEAWEPLDRAAEIYEAHESAENSCWVDYARSEVGFVSGDWDRAVEAGLRTIEVGDRNAYHRAVVRTWHVILPIAAARGNKRLLERAFGWYEAFHARGGVPDSPYTRIMLTMANLHFAAAGLIPPFVPDVEPLLESFRGAWSTPSSCSAIETVSDMWIAVGQLDGVKAALDQSSVGGTDDRSSSLGRAIHALIAAKVLKAEGTPDADVAEQARRALEGFRNSQASWWIFKTIGLLDSVRRASREELGEAKQIEERIRLWASE